MIIDTKEEALTLSKAKTLILVGFVLLTTSTVFFIPLNRTMKMFVCGGASALFLFYYWFQYRMEYTYFYFSNNNKNLIFKFYSLRNFYGKPKTIEIAKINFSGYDIISCFFNRKEMLVLYQKTPKGIAKYPPISLTLLSKKQKTELKRSLYAASNNK
jgi:hypothetical protein